MKLLKTKEILAEYEISRQTLYNWIKTGKIKVYKTPYGRGTNRYNKSEIDKAIK